LKAVAPDVVEGGIEPEISFVELYCVKREGFEGDWSAARPKIGGAAAE